ncbi:lipase member I-like [Ostrinia nubilalis]|uniref:lipase member I-like n=1 Tax=Ostrinia nubilalis TaxID=29057 RepID=UPI0030824757
MFYSVLEQRTKMFKEFLCFFAVLAFIEATPLDALARNAGASNTYTLYTKNNRLTGVLVSGLLSATSGFEAGRLTVILVHDHEGSRTDEFNDLVKYEILEHNDVNVVVVDWSTYASYNYNAAYIAVPSVAEYLYSFIVMNLSSLPFGNLHLIGFGLGAHICGMAARPFGGEVARITGLDPSGSGWGTNSPRLSKSDAIYVEVIHTDGSGLSPIGIGTALGDADFFVNGGGNQPGCLTHRCSHNRGYEIMAASMDNNIEGRLCSSTLQNTLNLCRGVTLAVGTNTLQKRGNGIYRANTKRYYPFV